ncbi:MAG: iron-sulfur cluster assembly accessory protein [Methylacidiphilales bacterium]|nr:iron-sulfur cluster assembly accessory protein [Candidatus Methylacidiphilales bacterium]MDW8349065.1 iron-sulfur cluster assembly accessory protein [Verrucomicrobiae bacterium]
METLLHITPQAAQQILKLTESKPKLGLRLHIAKGGCSGLEYHMNLTEPATNDYIIESHGARVYLDPQAKPYLQGATLHYEDALTGAGFRIRNPNATQTCGCGASFTTQ